MAGVTKKLEGHALRIGGFYDHAHLMIRIPAKIAVADFVRQLKANTSKHINEERNAILKPLARWLRRVHCKSFQSRYGSGLY